MKTNKICIDCGEQNKDGSWFEHEQYKQGFQCTDCEYEENGDCAPSDEELVYLFGYSKDSNRMR